MAHKEHGNPESPTGEAPPMLSASFLFKRASALMFDLGTLINKDDHKKPGLVVWRSQALLDELQREYGEDITDALCKELTKHPSYATLLEQAVTLVCTVVNEQLVPSIKALRKQAGPCACSQCGASPCPSKYENVEVLGECEMFPVAVPDPTEDPCTHDLRPYLHADTLACARLHMAVFHILVFVDKPEFEPILATLLPPLGAIYPHMDLFGGQSFDNLNDLAMEMINTEQIHLFGSGVGGLMRRALCVIQNAVDHETGHNAVENDEMLHALLQMAMEILFEVGDTEAWHEIVVGDPKFGGEIAHLFLSVGRMTMYHTSVFACSQRASLAEALNYCCSPDRPENTITTWYAISTLLLLLLCNGYHHDEKDIARVLKLPCSVHTGKKTTFERAAAMHTDVLVFMAPIDNEDHEDFVAALDILFPWLEVVQAGEKWQSYVYDIHTKELDSGVLRSHEHSEPENVAGKDCKDSNGRDSHASASRKQKTEMKSENTKSAGDGGKVSNIGACARCGGVGGGLQVCGGCRGVAYCGRNCHKAHWRAGHKTECQPRGATTTT